MEVSSRHKLIRFAFLLDDYVPTQITLCALFWRLLIISTTTLFGVCFGLAMAAALLLFLYIVTPFYPGFFYTLLGLGAVIFYIVKWSEEAFAYFNDKYKPVKMYDLFFRMGIKMESKLDTLCTRIENSLFWAVLKTVKSKACPIIKIKYE